MLQLERLLLLAALAISAVSADTQAIKNQVAYSGGLHDPFDPGFLESTRPAEYIIREMRGSLIPEGCKTRFQELKINPRDTEVYSVTYTDGCPKPWIFCRQNTAQLSITTMASLFGRLPLHMRGLVRHPIATRDPSCSAYSYTGIGDIVFRGECTTPSVWIHETGHQMDSMLNPANYHSGTSQWNDALNQDSCVPDNYANVNKIEDFAQVTVTALYRSIRGYIPRSDHPGCFDHQLGQVLQIYQAGYFAGSNECRGQVPPSPMVSKDGKSATARIVAPSPSEGMVVGPCKFE
ncbi:hypothetical protein TWF696_001262 [Orbilia brochopaga]|uniref:Uncharacterized protein n=1 Tax=Orbilia brochopaga TaxID=3140254 RepID=A0AAV9U841_9PEZI